MGEMLNREETISKMIDKERIVRRFDELVRIYSPSRGERNAMDFIKGFAEALGFDVYEDEAGKKIDGDAGNVIVTIPGNISGGTRTPSIMISAHVDTVEPSSDIEPVIEDGTIKSAGDTILGADDKAGVVAMLELLNVIAENKEDKQNKLLYPDMKLVFTIAEEIGLLGAKFLDMTENKTDHIYVLDSEGSTGTIVIAAPYQDSFEVEYVGKAAHAGVNPEDGINAIVAAAKAISLMKLGRIDDETTANIGIIEGGRAGNIVPETASVFGECRSIDKDKLEAQAGHMIECFKQGADEVGAEVKIRRFRPYSGYEVSENDEIVKSVVTAAESVGLETKMIKSGGGSDTNVFASKGVSAVNLGVGFKRVHSTKESVNIVELVNLAKLLVALVSVNR
jgi:tripeptide aminopeptidase